MNRDDHNHDACAKLMTTTVGPLIVPDLVVGEACYLVDKYLGPSIEATFLRSLLLPDIRLEALVAADLTRMAELVERYADLRLGATDASVIAAAERLGITTLATIDRRHFTVVRPNHVEAFELVP